jgi:pantoate--beta-alanine ligase
MSSEDVRPAVPPVATTPAEMRALGDALRRGGLRVALVPTMGALHAGHLALVEAARGLADRVVVSIFVNPLQFGEAGDFSGYPRPLDEDLASCASSGVDAVYAPTVGAMYPEGFDTRVVPGTLAQAMEGRSRPGHFEGVATVVAKLLTTVRPDVAVFGEKDYQQLAVVRRMSIDLDLGVEIVGHPTIREADGLALSSRNRRLTADQRAAAAVIPRAIAAAVDRASADGSTPIDVENAAVALIAQEPLAQLDYVSVFDTEDLSGVESFVSSRRVAGHYRIAIAARFGDVRLIDNTDLYR